MGVTDYPVFFPTQQIVGQDANRIVAAIKSAVGATGNLPNTQPTGGGTGSGLPPVGTPTGGGGTPTVPVGLGAVSGIDLIAQVNNGYVQLTWAANPGNDYVTEYDIRYRDASINPPVYVVEKVGGGLTTVKIPNLYPGHTYVFQVRAVNGAGRFSIWSAELSVPVAADTVPPDVPTGLLATSVTKGVWLQWNALAAGGNNGDLAGFDVAISTDGGLTFPTINQGDVGTTYFYSYSQLNPADNQKSLRFMVRSRDWSGNTSAWSNPGTGGTNGQPPYTGAGGVAGTVGGVAFDEITVGNIRALGRIVGGGITTRGLDGSGNPTGPGVTMLPTGIYGYNASNTVTFQIDDTTGNVTITGGLYSGGTVQGSTVIGATIETNSAPLTNGGTLIDNSGVRVVADGTSGQAKGTVTWYAQNNGQFLSAQSRTIHFGYQAVDASNPARCTFKVDTATQKIVKVLFSFYTDTFKVGNQTASSGGSSHSHSVSVAGQTASASGGHTHTIGLLDGAQFTDGVTVQYSRVHGAMGNQTGGSASIGTDSIGDHTHPVTSAGVTSASESSHTHPLNAPTAIYSAGGGRNCHVKVYNSAGTLVVDLGPYAAGGAGTFVADLDLTSYINTVDWWTVLVTSDQIGGIMPQITLREIVQSI